MPLRAERSPGGPPSTWHRLRPIVWLAVALAVAAMAVSTASPERQLTAPERWLRDALAPVQYGAARVGDALAGARRRLVELDQLQQVNRALREENERLRLELSLLAPAVAENERLRQALSYATQKPGYRLLVAEVLQRQPSQWYAHLVIDRGARDGVQPHMPVIITAGVVGQVQRVSERTAEVLLITDPRSAVGGLVERTGDLVVVEGRGTGDRLTVRALGRDAGFRPGDRVVTSGLGSVYPRGLVVGTLVRVEQPEGAIGREGELVPALELDRMLTVFVVLTAPEPADAGRP